MYRYNWQVNGESAQNYLYSSNKNVSRIKICQLKYSKGPSSSFDFPDLILLLLSISTSLLQPFLLQHYPRVRPRPFQYNLAANITTVGLLGCMTICILYSGCGWTLGILCGVWAWLRKQRIISLGLGAATEQNSGYVH